MKEDMNGSPLENLSYYTERRRFLSRVKKRSPLKTSVTAYASYNRHSGHWSFIEVGHEHAAFVERYLLPTPLLAREMNRGIPKIDSFAKLLSYEYSLNKGTCTYDHIYRHSYLNAAQ